MVLGALAVLFWATTAAGEVDVVRAVLVHEEHITTRTLATFVDELLKQRGGGQAPSRSQVPKKLPSSRPSFAARPFYYKAPPPVRQPPAISKTPLSPATVSHGAPPTHKPILFVRRDHERSRNRSRTRGSKSVAADSNDDNRANKMPSRDEYKKILNFFLTAFDQRY